MASVRNTNSEPGSELATPSEIKGILRPVRAVEAIRGRCVVPAHRCRRGGHDFQNAAVNNTSTGMISMRPIHISTIIAVFVTIEKPSYVP